MAQVDAKECHCCEPCIREDARIDYLTQSMRALADVKAVAQFKLPIDILSHVIEKNPDSRALVYKHAHNPGTVSPRQSNGKERITTLECPQSGYVGMSIVRVRWNAHNRGTLECP